MHPDNKIVSFVVITEFYRRFHTRFIRGLKVRLFARHNGCSPNQPYATHPLFFRQSPFRPFCRIFQPGFVWSWRFASLVAKNCAISRPPVNYICEYGESTLIRPRWAISENDSNETSHLGLMRVLAKVVYRWAWNRAIFCSLLCALDEMVEMEIVY